MNHGCSLTDLSFASSGTQETPKSKLKLPGKRQSKGGKARLQASDVRPSSDVRHRRARRRQPTTEALHRTSDVQQTMDVRNPHDRESANSSDVRWTSDVRHLGRPKPNGRPTSPAPDRQASTGPHRHDNFRTSDPHRTSDICKVRTSEPRR